MADNMSIDSSDSDSTSSDNSLNNEIIQLIHRCEQLNLHHQYAIESLHNIQEMLNEDDNIMAHYECEDHEFGELLESLHQKTLEAIQKGENSSFSQRLLELLEKTTFHK
jgi:hypothetical protein